MIIKQLKQIVTRVNPVKGEELAPVSTPKEKQYLLLLYFRDEEGTKDFEILTGRSETFTYLLENIDSIDLLESHIMPQNKALEKAITLYSFMRLCLEECMDDTDKENADFDEAMLKDHMDSFYDDMTEEELNDLYDEEINQLHVKKED